MSPLEAGTEFSTDSDDFMMAFAATRSDGEARHDPRYVRWQARFGQKVNGTKSETRQLLHPCTEEELTRLDPPENEKLAQEIEMQQNGGHLFCIDWRELSHDLFGYWRNQDNFSHVDVSLVPCGSTEAEADECVWDQEEVFEYMGSEWEMEVYHNQHSFQSNKYNEARIETKSTKTSIRNL